MHCCARSAYEGTCNITLYATSKTYGSWQVALLMGRKLYSFCKNLYTSCTFPLLPDTSELCAYSIVSQSNHVVHQCGRISAHLSAWLIGPNPSASRSTPWLVPNCIDLKHRHLLSKISKHAQRLRSISTMNRPSLLTTPLPLSSQPCLATQKHTRTMLVLVMHAQRLYRSSKMRISSAS